MFNKIKVTIAECKVQEIVNRMIETPDVGLYLIANKIKSEYAEKAFFGKFPMEDYTRIFKTKETNKDNHYLDLYIKNKKN